jgi:RNA-directed DNA polymerase
MPGRLRCVVKVDVRSFFDKVRHEAVYRLFRHELGFGREVARLLTRLTTRDSSLPQGTPTSPTIANLVLVPIDGKLNQRTTDEGVRCTRFVDDITLSGDDPRHLVNEVARLLSTRRLPIHRAKSREKEGKLQILPRSGSQEVTGLIVNGSSKVSLSKARRDRIRAAVHQFPTSNATRPETRSIAGRIEYAKRYNPGSGARLEAQLRVHNESAQRLRSEPMDDDSTESMPASIAPLTAKARAPKK